MPAMTIAAPSGAGMGNNDGISFQYQAELARKMQDYETLKQIITQWNSNRLDLFELSLPNEELEFHGVMRFYYQAQDNVTGQKVATKCIRVSSTATTTAIIETLIEKFRPDMKMLQDPEYALYEIHESGERRLNGEEKPLLVQLNWHKDDREGRFLLRRIDDSSSAGMLNVAIASNDASGSQLSVAVPENSAASFKRKLSKREKKALKKQEKKMQQYSTMTSGSVNGAGKKSLDGSVAEKLYTEVPDTSFTRSISNPEAVMRRRRQQKLEKKLQQFRSKDGGPDTGGTLKIYGETLCREVPYKTLLLSVGDTASFVVEEMLEKYGLNRKEAPQYCLVQSLSSSSSSNVQEYILGDQDCPLAILLSYPPNKDSLTFHIRRRPSSTNNFQPRKRKKPPLLTSENSLRLHQNGDRGWPYLLEMTSYHDGAQPQPFWIAPSAVSEIGAESASLGPLNGIRNYLKDRHCVFANVENDDIVTVTPCHREAETFVNNQRIYETTVLQHGYLIRFGYSPTFRFINPHHATAENVTSTANLPDHHQMPAHYNSNYMHFGHQLVAARTTVGKDTILPAVLEFREETEDTFFNAITMLLDVSLVHFKLAPTYTIYMATRFRASTHYRPELTPEERAVRLTHMLDSVSQRLYHTVQAQNSSSYYIAFWLANNSELLNFLRTDRHITAFSVSAQNRIEETVHFAFRRLIMELSRQLEDFMPKILMLYDEADESLATSGILSLLSSAMSVSRKCRVNAALTIQLFSHLFHVINAWIFNQLVNSSAPNYCTHKWGLRLKRRLSRIELWAEKQGLELAADCHMGRVVQASHLLMARKNTAEDIASVSSICFKLNSLQLRKLLSCYEPSSDENRISPDVIENTVKMAERTVDTQIITEGRRLQLEEDLCLLQFSFLLPEEGYSADVIRGIPGGLAEFIHPFQEAGLCVMTPQPTSSGLWTIYCDRVSHHLQSPSSSLIVDSTNANRSMPEVMVIQLQKSSQGMGLSIVAAKGVGQSHHGIYVKAVVGGGAAFHDGRIDAGDQLLRVDGYSLVGITQERAAEIMMQTGPIVELEVAKQGAIIHGLTTLLADTSPQNVSANHRMALMDAPSQHTYQNHRPGPPQHVHYTQGSPGRRSSSIQNLNHVAPSMGHRQGSIPVLYHPRQQVIAEEDSSFYQNLPSVSSLQHRHMPPPAPPQRIAPNHNQRYGSQLSLLSPNHRRSLVHHQDVLHHASPRTSGTPMTGHPAYNSPLLMNNQPPPGRIPAPLSSSGPEKPHRQYSYEMSSPSPHTPTLVRPPLSQVANETAGRVVRFHDGDSTTTTTNMTPISNTVSKLPMKNQNSNIPRQSVNSLNEMEFRKNIISPSVSSNHQVEDDEDDSVSDISRMIDEEIAIQTEEHEEGFEKNEIPSMERLQIEPSIPNSFAPPAPPLSYQHPPSPRPSQRLDLLLAGEQHKPDPEIESVPVKKVSFKSDFVENVFDNDDDDERTEHDQENNDIEKPKTFEDPDVFFNEAESLMSSPSLAGFNLNTSTGNTPTVIGSQEVYRGDPRLKRLQKAQEEKASSTKKHTDGAKLSFKEKMKLFAAVEEKSETKIGPKPRPRETSISSS